MKKAYWISGILILFIIISTIFIVTNNKIEIANIEKEFGIDGNNQENTASQSETDTSNQSNDNSTLTDIYNSPDQNNINDVVITSEKPKGDTESNDHTVLNQTIENVRVSAYGFGAYPEVPSDYPNQHVFSQVYEHPDYELMDRIRVKLWTQGEKGVIGMSEDNGLFYPSIRGVIYIKWESEETDTGIRRYATRTSGVREDLDFWDASQGPLWEDDIPNHLKVIDYSEGINPYTFLNLNIE